jgi:hypothetical protein
MLVRRRVGPQSRRIEGKRENRTSCSAVSSTMSQGPTQCRKRSLAQGAALRCRESGLGWARRACGEAG